MHDWYKAFVPDTWSIWAVALVGLAAALVALRTLRAIERQGKIAYKTLVAQFRPKVIVRNVKLDPSSGEEAQEGKQWKVQISLSNTGGTVAHIRSCEASLYWDKREEPRTSTEVCAETWSPFEMTSGERSDLEFEIPSEIGFPITLGVEEIDVTEKGVEQRVWLMCEGKLKYADDNGAERETGFLWAYLLKTREFTPSTDPDREYAD
jgi:hypothetical protein